MFDISGNDITSLNDTDLRSLVARLAIAELKSRGHPRSSVTAGGNQDAPDGGLDVRVECSSEIAKLDFVPRRLTGFQVKKPDMPASAIREEMRPQGKLRDVICELADASGAYVIVSSQGSVADRPLAHRRKALRDSVQDHPNADQLHTDFYDRERLANWVNEYPGTAAWVRGKVGRPLSGWSSINDWEAVQKDKSYLSGDDACLVDERNYKHERLTIADGIKALRDGLRTPRQCIRLVGMSGVGKTRLVQALFEEDVGEDALNLSEAVYTDYSVETSPTARDMARDLIAQNQRAILIVDNCNPATHSDLARLCASDSSNVSLITIEYDVRDDEPEKTDVFRLLSGSPQILGEWLKQNFPAISDADREKISQFSDGNFRVAKALAETLGKGESLGRLKNQDLFQRIFHQRNAPDQQLLKAAEDLSLVYSIDGEDVSNESELAKVALIRTISTISLYEFLVELRKRGVAQARGRFRAILPQAIANPLAVNALERIPSTRFDEFCAALTPRMLKSVSRRLGLLHDSLAAKATVERWMRADGPLGDLIAKGEFGAQIIADIAPVAPEVVMTKIEKTLSEQKPGETFMNQRHIWVRLTKAIAYDPHLFESAAILLARLLTINPDKRNFDSENSAFSELFHLHLSGTQASPQQRQSVIRRLAASHDEGLRRSAHIGVRALLQASHFSSMGGYDFGARSRDWGWEPQINGDVWDWYNTAIAMAVEILPDTEARLLVSKSVRPLWRYAGCRETIEKIASKFSQSRPWIEGWIACRATLRYDGTKMTDDSRVQLVQLCEQLKPADLLNRARAIILNRMPTGGLDFADGEKDEGAAINAWKKADLAAQEIGRVLASDDQTRAKFIPELLAESPAQRAFECGVGMAEGANDLNKTWIELCTAYGAITSSSRNPTLLAGFVFGANKLNPNLMAHTLEAAISDATLLPIIPYLHARLGIDTNGIKRLRKAIATGRLDAWTFHAIANNSISDSPPDSLALLIEDIATLSNGVRVALEVLHMYFFSLTQRGIYDYDLGLLTLGRSLLAHADFHRDELGHDYSTGELIRICLLGEDGQEPAKNVCANICSAIDHYKVSAHDLNETLEAILEVQPVVALDIFLDSPIAFERISLFHGDFGRKSLLEDINPDLLEEWASIAPEERYPALGRCIAMFARDGDKENSLSRLFVSMLKRSPDKRLFLGDIWNSIHPRSWSGSLADILMRRKELLKEVVAIDDDQIRNWAADVMPQLDQWINKERERESKEEESFE